MAEFSTPLALTSPLMRGQNVKDAQWLLAGHNRFDSLAPYKDGKIDGQYGPLTATATNRAWYWLGAPSAFLNGRYGRLFTQTLYEYLRMKDWRPLPTEWRNRRGARLAQAAKTPGMKALDEAVKYLGVKESPWGSNRQQFGVQYDMNGVPWCAIFESCMFRDSGYVTASGGWRFRYSYVPAIHDDAVNGRNGLRIVPTPKPGDIALFDIPGEGLLAHTAFVRRAPAGGSFTDLGGNTGPSNVSNGGEVLSQLRATSMIHSWVRVGG